MSEYPDQNKPWSRSEAQAAYYAEPPAPSAGVFWTALSVRLGRPMTAVYRRLAYIWRWPAKVQPELCQWGCGRKALRQEDDCNTCADRNFQRYKRGLPPNAGRKTKGLCACGQVVHCKGLCSACYQKALYHNGKARINE